MDYQGIVNWEDSGIRYDQTRNATESIIRGVLSDNGIKHGWLQSCGASSFCTLMEGLGALNMDNYLRFPNGDQIQMDDAIMMWMNDPRRPFAREDILENRRGDSYIAAAGLFGVKARYVMNGTFWEVMDELHSGNGVQLNLIDPGHWIAAIAADDRSILYMDSWGSRPELKNAGINEVLMPAEFAHNVKPFAIVYDALPRR